MISCLFALAGLAGFSIWGGVRYNRRFEETFPMGIMASVAVLYVFYLFDCLKAGVYAAALLELFFYASSLLYLVRSRKGREAFGRLLTPGFVAFVLALGAAVSILLDKTSVLASYVKLWDEYRMWAGVPKALFYTEKLQLGEMGGKILVYNSMQSYPPGMPLFQYLFNKLAGHFSDLHLLIGQAVVAFSLMLPLTKRVRWRQWYLIAPMALLMISLPLFCYNSNFDSGNFYYTLFVDPLVGLAAAYTLTLVFDRPLSGRFERTRFCLALFFLTVLKDSGVVLAAFALIAAALWELLLERTPKREALTACLAPAAFCLLPSLFWQLALKLRHVRAGSSNVLRPLSLFPLTDNAREALKNFFRALWERPVVRVNNLLIPGDISFAVPFLALLLLGLGLILALKGRRRREAELILGTLLLSNLVFLAGLLLVYMGPMGAELPSFPRYVNTALLEDLLVMLALLVRCTLCEGFAEGRGKSVVRGLCILSAAAFAVCVPLRKNSYAWMLPDFLDGLRYSETIVSALGPESGPCQVFYVAGDDARGASMTHHKTYYELLEYGILIRNGWPETDILYEDIAGAEEWWTKKLTDEKIDYVFFTQRLPGIVQRYAGMLPNGTYEIERLYRVSREGDGLRLLPLENGEEQSPPAQG